MPSRRLWTAALTGGATAGSVVMQKKCIVVDDVRSTRIFVAKILEGAGYVVIHARDGREGLAAIETSPDVDGVVCDVEMPNMSGIELLAAVQRHQRPPPFLMLTADASTERAIQAKRSGAKGWLLKPVKPELLLLAVERYFKPRP